MKCVWYVLQDGFDEENNRGERLNAFIVLLCILFYLVGLAIFMSYFLAFVFILLLSNFYV